MFNAVKLTLQLKWEIDSNEKGKEEGSNNARHCDFSFFLLLKGDRNKRRIMLQEEE